MLVRLVRETKCLVSFSDGTFWAEQRVGLGADGGLSRKHQAGHEQNKNKPEGGRLVSPGAEFHVTTAGAEQEMCVCGPLCVSEFAIYCTLMQYCVCKNMPIT